MTVLLALLRLVGRLFIAVSDEIDRAVTDYRTEVPDVIPAWVDEEADLD